MKVLIAEDEDHIRKGLVDILKTEGYETIAASDGQMAQDYYFQYQPDFVCLDIMMPIINGYEVCKTIRNHNQHIPIIFISAKSEEIDKVLGLELGADDYINKPFGVKEVVARIRAITRRCMLTQKAKGNVINTFQLHNLTIVPAELIAYVNDQKIELSLRDIKILSFFYQRQDQAVDRDAIFNACWGHDYLPSSRTLDQHISKLRKKIEKDPKNPRIIQTIHGFGYRCPCLTELN